MNDREIAEIVNRLTGVAREYCDAQQLRARIADQIVDVLKDMRDRIAELERQIAGSR